MTIIAKEVFAIMTQRKVKLEPIERVNVTNCKRFEWNGQQPDIANVSKVRFDFWAGIALASYSNVDFREGVDGEEENKLMPRP